MTIADLCSDKSPEAFQQMLSLVNNGSAHASLRHQKKNGEAILADVTGSVIEYKNHRAVLLVIKDVTEEERLQTELINEKLNKEKKILEATLHGQELERVEIGKELHDNINQMLGAVSLYLDMAGKDKVNGNEYIKKGREIVMEAINEIRTLSKTLVAPGINEVILSESINDLIWTIQQTKPINITFQAKCKIDDLPGKVKLTLFRIVQEQLNNILKHAMAKNVDISICGESDDLQLTIRDDGKGFDTTKKKNGIGLNNIHSRTAMYKGRVKIKSAPGKGCLLQVSIPSYEIYQMAV